VRHSRIGLLDNADAKAPDAGVEAWDYYLAATCPPEPGEDRIGRAARAAKTAQRVDPEINRSLREDVRFHRHHGFFPGDARTAEQCRIRDLWQEHRTLESPALTA
jgi:hypothetical protein